MPRYSQVCHPNCPPRRSRRTFSRIDLDTSVRLRGLNLNHIYAVRVRAENNLGVSDPSQPVTSRLLTRSRLFDGTKKQMTLLFDDLADERPAADPYESASKSRRPPTSSLDDYGGKNQ
jgi:hypothetical protein